MPGLPVRARAGRVRVLKRKHRDSRAAGGRSAGAGAARPPASSPGASAGGSGAGRRWVFRLLAGVLVPLILLVGAEVGLRLADYGFSTAFFKPLERGGERMLVENDKFGWRFFPPAVARSPAPVVMPARKAPGTCRILVFGESAALGDPRPAYGFSRYLEVLLRERLPEGRFEVVNVSMAAISSHVVREIARECAAHDADVWVVYMGNNEYYGPFGAGTVFGAQAPSLGVVRARLAIERTRLGQWLGALARRGQPPAVTNWSGLRMFLGQELGAADPRRAVVQANFAANLEAILRYGTGSGARVLLSSMAVNLRECGPFASRHGSQLAAADQEDWTGLYETAGKLQAAGEAAAAGTLLRKAVEESPDHAEARFRLAEAEAALTNGPAARAEYQRAVDLDALPFRADSRLNAILREAAGRQARRGVVWVDAAGVLDAAAPEGVAGAEAFHEHVHLRFDGNYVVARAFADAVLPLLPAAMTNRAGAAWASQEVCERRLGLTDWNRHAVVEGVLGRVIEPPFTNQLHASERLGRLWRELEEIRARMEPSAQAEARALYEDAIRRSPQDHRLHENFAEFLEMTGELRDAAGEWVRVRELIPHHFAGWYHSGRLLARSGDAAAGLAALGESLRLRPDLVEAMLEVAGLEAAEGRLEAALARCDAALVLRPGEARPYIRRADVLARLKRRDETVASLREAVRVQPSSWEARYLLGVELAVDSQLREAEAEFAEVVRVRPNHVLARVNLGVALAKQARFDEAEAQFEEVLKLDPVNARALQSLEMIQQLRERGAGRPRQP